MAGAAVANPYPRILAHDEWMNPQYTDPPPASQGDSVIGAPPERLLLFLSLSLSALFSLVLLCLWYRHSNELKGLYAQRRGNENGPLSPGLTPQKCFFDDEAAEGGAIKTAKLAKKEN
jgi:hypothetical protein